MLAVFLFLEYLLFFFIRFLPVWRFRHQGCDAYYFLLTAEVFRKNKKIPIVLPPYYLADIDEQWYPPGFSVLLGLLPESFVKNYHWLINHLLDFLNMVVLDGFLWFYHVGYKPILIANLVYIFTPTLTLEYRALTSRSLANLLFTLFMLSLWGAMENVYLIPLALFFWMLILFSHKMTMQLGLVMALALSVVFKTWVPVMVVYGGIPLAIVISRGYYCKILKGHWDIVSFWHKNLPWLGAHQVYDSPVYGKENAINKGQESLPIKIYSILKSITYHNPFLALYVVAFLLTCFPGSRSYFGHEFLKNNFRIIGLTVMSTKFLNTWLLLTFVWGIMTTLFPFFKALGEGYKYLKYSAFPVVFLFVDMPKLILVLGFVLTARILLKFVKNAYLTKQVDTTKIDKELEAVYAYIKDNQGLDRIGCINSHMADSLVYFCRRKVLWGTHHFYFNAKVRDFFPVFRNDIGDISQKYNIKYWLINKSYVDVEILGFNHKKIVYDNSKYRIYSL